MQATCTSKTGKKKWAKHTQKYIRTVECACDAGMYMRRCECMIMDCGDRRAKCDLKCRCSANVGEPESPGSLFGENDSPFNIFPKAGIGTRAPMRVHWSTTFEEGSPLEPWLLLEETRVWCGQGPTPRTSLLSTKDQVHQAGMSSHPACLYTLKQMIVVACRAHRRIQRFSDDANC